jgi:hypothetical protein
MFLHNYYQALTSPSVLQDEQSVDFVLVWTEGSSVSCTDAAYKKREVFERHLVEEGLILEREQNLSLHFIKIHAPVEVLGRYAEILKLRMPMRKVVYHFHTSVCGINWVTDL